MNRRNFLKGMAGILASGMAPAVIGSGVLMPVRTIWTSRNPLFIGAGLHWHDILVYEQFYYGHQWTPDEIVAIRERGAEPLVINHVKPFVDSFGASCLTKEYIEAQREYNHRLSLMLARVK